MNCSKAERARVRALAEARLPKMVVWAGDEQSAGDYTTRVARNFPVWPPRRAAPAHQLTRMTAVIGCRRA
jgi:hypothetical protein